MNPVLYPMSYGSRRATLSYCLALKLVTSLLSSLEKRAQIFIPSATSMGYLNRFLRRPIFLVGTAAAVLFLSCTASNSPLSVALYNPKTGVQRTCSAKESSSKDVPALSNAVEMCAKQLEARGFVRSDSR